MALRTLIGSPCGVAWLAACPLASASLTNSNDTFDEELAHVTRLVIPGDFVYQQQRWGVRPRGVGSPLAELS